MDEDSYSYVTRDLTLAFARRLADRNRALTFVYVSGAGSDAQSSTMWARVKGQTEAALGRIGFRSVYCLRPGVILPMHGERSGVRAYRIFYLAAGPLLRILRILAPRHLLTTEIIGRAMLALARRGTATAILEAPDIYDAARRGGRG